MQYRNDKYGRPLSILGYGCMRFTKKGGGIDIDKTEKPEAKKSDLAKLADNLFGSNNTK